MNAVNALPPIYLNITLPSMPGSCVLSLCFRFCMHYSMPQFVLHDRTYSSVGRVSSICPPHPDVFLMGDRSKFDSFSSGGLGEHASKSPDIWSLGLRLGLSVTACNNCVWGVGIAQSVTRRAGRPGFKSRQGQDLFFTSQRPEGLWGLPSRR
jgi:hypothetical protein